MDVKPFFSIVIPSYNRGYIIGDAIESLLRQKFKDWELIIVDDGSEDNTHEIVEKYRKIFPDKIFYYKLNKNMGVNKARNFGAQMARGEWIIFQDSDDKFTENALEILYELTQSVNTPLIWTACVNLDGKMMTNKPEFEGYLSYREMLCEKLKGEYLPTVKKEVFMKFRFPEDINGAPGILWLFIAKSYGKIFVSNKITRIYNNKLFDRLSVKKRNFGRLNRVFKKNLKIFGKEYIKYCPVKLLEKSLKYLIYKTLSLKG